MATEVDDEEEDEFESIPFRLNEDEELEPERALSGAVHECSVQGLSLFGPLSSFYVKKQVLEDVAEILRPVAEKYCMLQRVQSEISTAGNNLQAEVPSVQSTAADALRAYDRLLPLVVSLNVKLPKNHEEADDPHHPFCVIVRRTSSCCDTVATYLTPENLDIVVHPVNAVPGERYRRAWNAPALHYVAFALRLVKKEEAVHAFYVVYFRNCTRALCGALASVCLSAPGRMTVHALLTKDQLYKYPSHCNGVVVNPESCGGDMRLLPVNSRTFVAYLDALTGDSPEKPSRLLLECMRTGEGEDAAAGGCEATRKEYLQLVTALPKKSPIKTVVVKPPPNADKKKKTKVQEEVQEEEEAAVSKKTRTSPVELVSPPPARAAPPPWEAGTLLRIVNRKMIEYDNEFYLISDIPPSHKVCVSARTGEIFEYLDGGLTTLSDAERVDLQLSIHYMTVLFADGGVGGAEEPYKRALACFDANRPTETVEDYRVMARKTRDAQPEFEFEDLDDEDMRDLALMRVSLGSLFDYYYKISGAVLPTTPNDVWLVECAGKKEAASGLHA